MAEKETTLSDKSKPILRFEGRHAFLSNFHPSPVQALPPWRGTPSMIGETAPTVEHAYQAAKCADPVQRAAILLAKSAGVAKRLGRKAQLRDGWDEDRVGVMRGLLAQKFAKEAWGGSLLATGASLLVEGNEWSDDFWGACPGVIAEVGPALVGRNVLGTLLMERREALGGVGFPADDAKRDVPPFGSVQAFVLTPAMRTIWVGRERPDDGDR